ncbi:MAG: alpha-amylase family glycosyl hydrolase [Verrucomicrobiota bacterium]
MKKCQSIRVLFLLMAIGGLAASAYAQPASINGAYDPAFGSALCVQTDATGFGLNQSELDGAYGLITNGNLYLFLSGNLQNNGNNINLFIAGTGGQSTLNAANPGNLAANNLSVMNGSQFSPGFSAIYGFNINNTNKTLTVSQYNLTDNTSVDALGSLTESGNIVANGTVDNSVVVGFNNNNSQSQADDVGQGSLGLELAIPLSLIGNPGGPIQVMADINGYQEGYLSNQLLPGLPGGTANLGSGGTYSAVNGDGFNFSSTAGEYFTVPASSGESPVLTINGLNADYGTTHVFVNEVSNDAVPLTILFSPNASTNVVETDVFSNLNRRNYANVEVNGVPEGILPPDPNTIATGDTNDYYEAYPMTPTSTPGQYTLTLYAQKTGAYRLTARWMVAGGTNWNWYSINTPYSTGTTTQDFMVVVSPKRAMSMVLYELAVNNIGAQGDDSNGSQRSTFTDLYNGPGSRAYNSVSNRFNLNYVTNLGVNWLWLEPMHPIGVLDSINSPYCVKDYFQISPWMSKEDTEAGGMTEFQGFVAAANTAGVNVMIDEPFDHTAHDVLMETEGVTDFGGTGNPNNFQPTDLISADVPEFFSPNNSYCSQATGTSNPSIALAPDEGEFAKWTDVIDIFHGVYAARVCENPTDNNNYLTTNEWFDYTTNTGSFNNITENVWKYFADELLYWLTQSGCTNGTPANQTASVGIGGIRADFAEGLPPQCWEYIINTVRCQKWDFVFLAESLSDSTPTYRSSRDFDVVDDSILYAFRTNTIDSQYENDFNSEQANYGQCLMMWNTTSHDVGFYYTDPYQALLRYMIGGTIYGVPHMLYGQEVGTTSDFGFSLYTVSGTEYVPDLYAFNSLQPAYAATVGNLRVDQLYPLYTAVGMARQSSPALQSANRVFLIPYTTSKPDIYAVGKFAITNGSPNFNDVVFAFVNLAYTNSEQGYFDVNLSQNGTNIYGIESSRMYNAKNIAAYLGVDPNRSSYWLWGTNGIAGSTLLTTGVPVSLNSVPTNSVGWTNAPYEAQYLKLYDVTPPPTPSAPGIGSTNNYVLTNIVTFTWSSVTDSIGGVSGYHVIVGTSPGASDVFNGIVQGTTLTVTNIYGATLYAEVGAINNAGIQGPASASSAGVILVNPDWIPVLSMQGNYVLNWTSVSGITYQVWYTTNLGVPFTPVGGVITAVGPTTQYTNTLPGSQGFYQVQIFP